MVHQRRRYRAPPAASARFCALTRFTTADSITATAISLVFLSKKKMVFVSACAPTTFCATRERSSLECGPAGGSIRRARLLHLRSGAHPAVRHLAAPMGVISVAVPRASPALAAMRGSLGPWAGRTGGRMQHRGSGASSRAKLLFFNQIQYQIPRPYSCTALEGDRREQGGGASTHGGMRSLSRGCCRARLVALQLLLAGLSGAQHKARVGDTIGGIPVMGDGTAPPRPSSPPAAATTQQLTMCVAPRRLRRRRVH